MKFSSFILIATIGLSGFVFSGCEKSQADSETVVELPPAPEVPELLPRHPALGDSLERSRVENAYYKNLNLVSNDPWSAEPRLRLAEVFMYEARVTGEHPYYYSAALAQLDQVFEESQPSKDERFQALMLKASVLLSQHEFADARELGEEAKGLYPRSAAVYGVLVDANVELGDYDQAVKYADQMVSIRPDMRSYSRISYLREIHGEVDGAIEAMKMAIEAVPPGSEERAWCRTTLGGLHEEYGDLKAAAFQYRMALSERTDYPFALGGWASVEEKQGHLDRADSLLERAQSIIPEVGFYTQRMELFKARGQADKAEELAETVLAMMEEDRESGHNMDLELSEFYLEQRRDASEALKWAENAHAARPENMDVNLRLAEVHYALGHTAEARHHLAVAQRTDCQKPKIQLLDGALMAQTGKAGPGQAQIREAFDKDPHLGGWVAESVKSDF